MSRKMDHTIAFGAPADVIYAMFGNLDYWETMAERYREVAPQSELVEFRCDADGIDVEFRQVLAATELPAIVRTVIPLDMAITRRQHFGPYDPTREGAEGNYTASVARAPGRLDGRYDLTSTATGARLTFANSCKVPVPLIGGKLEGMALQFMKDVLTAEEAFTAGWIAEHR